VGVQGTVVIAHGSSSRLAIANALAVAAEGASRDLPGTIEAGLHG
jgi:fatty acid/phospholipid biosynthesis enzyme